MLNLHKTKLVIIVPPVDMASRNRSSKKPQNHGINDSIKLVTACIAMAIISGIFLPYLKKKITNILFHGNINRSNVGPFKHYVSIFGGGSPN